MKRVHWLTALVAGTASAACSSAYVSTWNESLDRPLELDRTRVAAIVVSADESVRKSGEDALARELSRGGAQGTACYTLLPAGEVPDVEGAKRILSDANVEGAVVLWVVAGDDGTSAELPDPDHRSFWEFWSQGWPAADAGDGDVSVLTLVYSVTGDRLLWAGRSGTTSAEDTTKLLRRVSMAARKEMKRAGYLS